MFSAVSIVKMNTAPFIFIFFCFVRHLHSSNTIQKIINGVNTEINLVPFLLSLRVRDSHSCGATIINQQWAVTAAHCFMNIKELNDVTLCSGSSNLYKNYVVHKVDKFIIHENYDPNTNDYDIALILVKSPFEYDDGTQAVDLPSDKDTCSKWGIICGWGHFLKFHTNIIPIVSKNIKCAVVPRIDKRQCLKYYGDRFILTEQMMCYGFQRGGVDTCQGDSGGPIVNCNNVLIGITSWGDGCADKYRPGVYTDIKSLIPWIKNITGKNC